MARKTTKICDICKKETEQIAGKLFFTPVTNGRSSVDHTNYSHHADVGVCCRDKLLRGFSFTKRLTAEQYQAQRKAG